MLTFYQEEEEEDEQREPDIPLMRQTSPVKRANLTILAFSSSPVLSKSLSREALRENLL